MPETKKPEVWLSGSLPGISSYLQPVGHALLQAKEEVAKLMKGFPEELLWTQPSGLASPGFHLQHLSGVIDRLFTYAAGRILSNAQLQALKVEGTKNTELSVEGLVQNFNRQVAIALEQLKRTDENSLNEFRGVGRAQLPSTVLGLLVHAAEHTMRHVGQLLVTVRIIKPTKP